MRIVQLQRLGARDHKPIRQEGSSYACRPCSRRFRFSIFDTMADSKLLKGIGNL
jgi:hypothetical protein